VIERALTLGLAAALALAGSQYLRAEHYQAGAAHEQAARQRDLAAMAQATAAASEAARVEEQRRSAAQLELGVLPASVRRSDPHVCEYSPGLLVSPAW